LKVQGNDGHNQNSGVAVTQLEKLRTDAGSSLSKIAHLWTGEAVSFNDSYNQSIKGSGSDPKLRETP
jgi:hypothetical protein